MITLIDGNTVYPRTYYYLLDFNDRDNWKTLKDLFGVMKLNKLNINQYLIFFDHATNQDKAMLANTK
jgi:hypothetical protein